MAVRNIRSELGVAPGVALTVMVRADGEDQRFLQAHETEIAALARVGTLTVGADNRAATGLRLGRGARVRTLRAS